MTEEELMKWAKLWIAMVCPCPQLCFKLGKWIQILCSLVWCVKFLTVL